MVVPITVATAAVEDAAAASRRMPLVELSSIVLSVTVSVPPL